MNLSQHTTDVYGFDSTFEQDKQVLVRDAGTETIFSAGETSEKENQTVETNDIGIQASPVVTSNSDEETDRKLAAWLKKILPAVEKELKEGATQVHESDSRSSNSHLLSVGAYQEINLIRHYTQSIESSDQEFTAAATWLSVSMQNNPILAIARTNRTLNEHKNTLSKAQQLFHADTFMIILEPVRNKLNGNIFWSEELTVLSLREPIDFLVTNPENRDIFAGASTAGHLYIWNYNKGSGCLLQDIFSKTSEESIAGISFTTGNCLISCSTDGNIIVYKVVSKQNCVVDKTLKIEATKLKDSMITAMTTIENSSDFIVGLFNGKLFHCTTNVSHGSTDPIIRELNSHKFAVKYLKHCQMSSKNYIASCDTSSEIFIHEIDEDAEKSTLKLVIKLPLPLKNSLSITNNMEYILCPLTNGGLEIFSTMTNTRKTLEGNISGSGTGTICELSKNESWLITGIHGSILKIYNVSSDDD